MTSTLHSHPSPATPASSVVRSAPARSAARLSLVAATTLVGLSAGFFVAYVSSVTRGLADVSDVTYVETFQAINASVRNPLFGMIFFGSVPALVVAIGLNWTAASPVRRILLVLSLPLYLAVIMVTGTGNVPLNNDLADLVVSSPEMATQARSVFEQDWNRLNLVRTLLAVASFASLAAASVFTDE